MVLLQNLAAASAIGGSPSATGGTRSTQTSTRRSYSPSSTRTARPSSRSTRPVGTTGAGPSRGTAPSPRPPSPPLARAWGACRRRRKEGAGLTLWMPRSSRAAMSFCRLWMNCGGSTARCTQLEIKKGKEFFFFLCWLAPHNKHSTVLSNAVIHFCLFVHLLFVCLFVCLCV